MRAIAVITVLAISTGGCASVHRETTSFLLDRAYTQADPPATEYDWQVVAFARSQVGKPYCWGGSGPSCFDCSGLVKEAWATVGVRLPHSAGSMPRELVEIPLSAVRPGDILWWPQHVALYAGNGWSIEALNRREGVVARAARDPQRAFRPLG